MTRLNTDTIVSLTFVRAAIDNALARGAILPFDWSRLVLALGAGDIASQERVLDKLEATIAMRG
jgi:hypothetical protein